MEKGAKLCFVNKSNKFPEDGYRRSVHTSGNETEFSVEKEEWKKKNVVYVNMNRVSINNVTGSMICCARTKSLFSERYRPNGSRRVPIDGYADDDANILICYLTATTTATENNIYSLAKRSHHLSKK